METEKRLFDKKEAIKLLRGKCVGKYPSTFAMGLFAAADEIEKLPEVDAVEVVHGRWVLTAHEEQCNFRWNVTAECSECQHSKGEIYAGHFSGFPKELVESMIPTYAKKVKLDNYCPNCGAKMDGGAVNG